MASFLDRRDSFPETVDKVEIHREDAPCHGSLLRILFSKLMWLLWRLPCMFSADLGRLGPGFGIGVGFGCGIGVGLIGGAGFGFGLPGMHFGVGFGAGFGVGMGFGYGAGKGWAFDEYGEHCNLPGFHGGSRDKRSLTLWDESYLSSFKDTPTLDKEEGTMWDQFLLNSKLAFDSFEKGCKPKKQSS